MSKKLYSELEVIKQVSVLCFSLSRYDLIAPILFSEFKMNATLLLLASACNVSPISKFYENNACTQGIRYSNDGSNQAIVLPNAYDSSLNFQIIDERYFNLKFINRVRSTGYDSPFKTHKIELDPRIILLRRFETIPCPGTGTFSFELLPASYFRETTIELKDKYNKRLVIAISHVEINRINVCALYEADKGGRVKINVVDNEATLIVE